MFPNYRPSLQALPPEIYFGGRSVPPYYRKKHASEPTPEEVIDEVRLIASDRACSGYINEEGIHLHLFDDDEEVRVDMSREFILLATPEELPAVPSSWHLLRFLQEPARRALWIDRNVGIYAEKSERTMGVCQGLDALWREDSFLQVAQYAVVEAEAHDRLLPLLMTRYEQRVLGETSAMWHFFDTFALTLASERLFLTIRVINSRCQHKTGE